MIQAELSVLSHKPVFIVGMNGSGTTMMLDHLGRHPDLFGFAVETYVLPHYLLRQQRYGDLTADENFLRLWNDMRGEYAFRKRNKGQPIELPDNWADVSRSAAGIFDRILLGFAARDGKSRWCEKTPMYVLHIERLARALPAAVFIHMIRDGRDCAASDHRRWGRHPNATITRWKHVVAEGGKQGGRIGNRYFEVRYEDVTNNPQAEMRRICEYLGVGFDQRVLTMQKSPRNLGRNSKVIVSNRNRGAQYFDDKRSRQLIAIAGKQLALLGYPNDSPDGDRNPGLLQRFWWFLYDARAVFIRQLRNKLTVQKRMTWSLYLARMKSTVRKTRSSMRGAPKYSGDGDD